MSGEFLDQEGGIFSRYYNLKPSLLSSHDTKLQSWLHLCRCPRRQCGGDEARCSRALRGQELRKDQSEEL